MKGSKTAINDAKTLFRTQNYQKRYPEQSLKVFVFFLLTRNRGGIFSIHRKVGCLNFEPQYLLNYSSPKNDFYSVQKKSIRAFKSVFKLLGWGPASAGTLRALFFARSSPLACGFAALAPDFAPKLCTRRVSACFSACFKTF